MKSDLILTLTAAVQSAQLFLTGFLRCIAGGRAGRTPNPSGVHSERTDSGSFLLYSQQTRTFGTPRALTARLRFLPAGRLQHGRAAGVPAGQPGLLGAQSEGRRREGAARAGAGPGAAEGGRAARPGPAAGLAARLLHRGHGLQRRQPQLPQLPQLRGARRQRLRGHPRVGTQVPEAERAVLAQRGRRPVAPRGCSSHFRRRRWGTVFILLLCITPIRPFSLVTTGIQIPTKEAHFAVGWKMSRS